MPTFRLVWRPRASSSQTTAPAAPRVGRQPLDLPVPDLPYSSAVPTARAHPSGGEGAEDERARLLSGFHPPPPHLLVKS